MIGVRWSRVCATCPSGSRELLQNFPGLTTLKLTPWLASARPLVFASPVDSAHGTILWFIRCYVRSASSIAHRGRRKIRRRTARTSPVHPLRGSTRLADDGLLTMLYSYFHYFDEMAIAIDATGGHYSNFTGDGLMALFGLEADVTWCRTQRSIVVAHAGQPGTSRSRTRCRTL